MIRSNIHHNQKVYLDSYHERMAYIKLLKDYIGEDEYYAAIGQQKPLPQLPHELVSRDTIQKFIEDKKKDGRTTRIF